VQKKNWNPFILIKGNISKAFEIQLRTAIYCGTVLGFLPFTGAVGW
jgi:hypothetical protein